MTYINETPSGCLAHLAQAEARRSVSKWRWRALGACFGVLPVINWGMLGISIIVICILTPKINLSTPERVRIYSQHPARYTARYCTTAKRVRLRSTFCGWIVGVAILNLFLT